MRRAVSITFARALAGAGLAMVLALAAPFAFHARPLVVMSGSMEPALHVGDVVVVQRIAPLEARAGDIVTFHDPARRGRLVIHRIRSQSVQGSTVLFATQGDANNATEHWSIRPHETISRAVVTIPKVGHGLLFLHRSTGQLICLLLLALAIVAELIAIWRPDNEAADRAPTPH